MGGKEESNSLLQGASVIYRPAADIPCKTVTKLAVKHHQSLKRGKNIGIIVHGLEQQANPVRHKYSIEEGCRRMSNTEWVNFTLQSVVKRVVQRLESIYIKRNMAAASRVRYMLRAEWKKRNGYQRD